MFNHFAVCTFCLFDREEDKLTEQTKQPVYTTNCDCKNSTRFLVLRHNVPRQWIHQYILQYRESSDNHQYRMSGYCLHTYTTYKPRILRSLQH